jgi:predicted  nucleic acid-binding Zn-ribbon protein
MDEPAPAMPHEQLLKQLQSVQAEIESSAARARESENHLRRLADENASLQQRVQSLTAERDSARAATDQALKDKAAFESRCSQLAGESAAARSRADALRKECDEIRDEAMAALEEDEKEMALLRGQMAQLQTAHSRLVSEEEKWILEKQGHAANLHALESLLKDARADRERLQSESLRRQEDAEKLREKIAQSDTAIRKLTQDKEEALASLKKSEDVVSRVRTEMPTLQKAVLELDAKLKQTEQSAAQVREENKKFQARIRELEEQKAAQQKQLEEDFRRALREKEEVISTRGGDLEKARKSHTELQDRLQLNQRELESIRLEKKKLEENLHTARENSDAAAQARAALDLKEQEIGAKETENRQLRQQQESALTKLSETEKLIQSLQSEKQRLAVSVEKIKQDAAGQLSAALAVKDSEIRDLQSRLESRNHEWEAARKQAESRLQSLEAEEEKARNLEKQIARLKAQIKEEEADWQQALDTVEQFRAQAQQFGGQKQALETDLAAKQRELAARQQENAVLKDQLQMLQGSLSMMRSELLQLRNAPQPARETDWILSGISILAQQARSGNADLKGVLKSWLAESERGGASVAYAPAPMPVTAAPPHMPSSSSWNVPAPAPSVVQITPPDLVPGAGPVFGTTGHHLRQLEQVDLPGDLVISLDELRCAVLDSSWRDKWKAGEKPNPFQGTSAVYRGKAEEIFYLVARDFLDWLVQPEGVNDPAQFGEKELWQYMYELFAAERLDRLVQRNDFEGTNFLSRRLRSFCRRLAALKERTPGFHAWNDLLRADLRDLKRVVFPLHERRLVIQGKLYGLRAHPKHGVEIADWKVVPESEDAGDLADLALQVLIFHKAYPEAPFAAGLDFYTQDFSAREVSRNDLNRVLRSQVVPSFYDLAGMPKPPGLENSSLDFFPPTHSTEIVHG